MPDQTTSPTLVTERQMAEVMHLAIPNRFGSVSARKEIIPNSRKQALADEFLKGRKLYSEYSYYRMATMKDYGNAVNNAKERDGQERTFEPLPLKWGEHWVHNGVTSPMVIIHKDKFYLQIRVTKNTIKEGRYVLSDGTEVTYEEIEPFLKAGDKKETKAKSIQATADRQGVDKEDAVHPRSITMETITRLAYDGNVYGVIPEAIGAVSAPVTQPETISEEETEERSS